MRGNGFRGIVGDDEVLDAVAVEVAHYHLTTEIGRCISVFTDIVVDFAVNVVHDVGHTVVVDVVRLEFHALGFFVDGRTVDTHARHGGESTLNIARGALNRHIEIFRNRHHIVFHRQALAVGAQRYKPLGVGHLVTAAEAHKVVAAVVVHVGGIIHMFCVGFVAVQNGSREIGGVDMAHIVAIPQNAVVAANVHEVSVDSLFAEPETVVVIAVPDVYAVAYEIEDAVAVDVVPGGLLQRTCRRFRRCCVEGFGVVCEPKTWA